MFVDFCVETDAVRRNRLTSEATDLEIDKEIKEWLRFAHERDCGKKERIMRKGAQDTPATDVCADGNGSRNHQQEQLKVT